ncbi:MAG: rhomboid family intramembrane serine protease [Limisphaerales bacterium]
MESEAARIAAHCRQEAMDWGLVLASQGIEAVIEGPEGEGSWGVAVAARDYEEALGAISQYRLENRGWPSTQAGSDGGYPFDWGSLVWVLLVVLFFWLEARPGLRPAGMMVSSRVAQGQWWRLFTAVWLHADVGHLAANATLGFVLLGLVMGRYGSGVGLLAAYMTGVAGNVGAWLLAPGPHRSLGASGMVLGSLGLLAAQAFSPRTRDARASRLFGSGVLAGVMLFVLLGLGPGTDVVAHLGGFLSGLLIGAGLAVVPGLAQKAAGNLLCGLIFGALVVLPWWLAGGSGPGG